MTIQVPDGYQPTEKGPVLEGLLTDMSPVGLSRQEALEQKRCTHCGEGVEGFDNPRGLKEYSISGWCQKCQNKMFGGSE